MCVLFLYYELLIGGTRLDLCLVFLSASVPDLEGEKWTQKWSRLFAVVVLSDWPSNKKIKGALDDEDVDEDEDEDSDGQINSRRWGPGRGRTASNRANERNKRRKNPRKNRHSAGVTAARLLCT